MSTNAHPIEPRTARHLADQVGALPETGGALVIAVAEGRQRLHLQRIGKGHQLACDALPVTEWADAFGVLPYRAGRVALATSVRGAWVTAKERAQRLPA